METRRLEYFHALAQDGNFSRTAERLRISQSALSQQIQRLEAEVGAYLLDRTARPITLTETGAQLLEHSAGVLEHMRPVEHLSAAARRGETGNLQIGVIPLVLFSRVPERVRVFQRHFPDVRVTLRRLNTSVLMDDLETGRVDVAFLNATPPTSDIQYADLYTSPLSVALPSDHDLVARETLSLAELRDEPLIMFPREHAPENFDRIIVACMDAGFSPRVITETGGYAAQVGYVAAGMGGALLPSEIDSVHNPSVVRVPLSCPELVLTTRVAWRPSKLNSHVRSFLDDIGSSLPARGSGAADRSVGRHP